MGLSGDIGQAFHLVPHRETFKRQKQFLAYHVYLIHTTENCLNLYIVWTQNSNITYNFPFIFHSSDKPGSAG